VKRIHNRRKLTISFNKREADFESRREHDDYLEKVEEWSRFHRRVIDI
jgi:thiamine kinase-like enzyme